jgi:hypothetical protein
VEHQRLYGSLITYSDNRDFRPACIFKYFVKCHLNGKFHAIACYIKVRGVGGEVEV